MTRTRLGSRRSIVTLGLVALGGFLGANARFFVTRWVTGPEGTLLVNAAGSVLLGILLYHARFAGSVSRRTRLMVGTGVLSSFTTYSTFALDAYQLGVAGLVYVAGSYAAGFAGVVLGRFLARSIVSGETS